VHAARRRGDRGAVLLELALALPFLAGLIVGTAEMGVAWVAANRVEGAVAHAARVGAAVGSRPEADREILVSLRASLPPAQLALVDRVVVYRSTEADGKVPAGCIKAVGDPSEVGTAACNSYTGTTLRAVGTASMAGFGGGSGAKDGYWPPAARLDALSDPPDHLGVWIRTRNDPLTTGSLGDVAITARSTFRIQPDIDG
jgi:hypothetical protein